LNNHIDGITLGIVQEGVGTVGVGTVGAGTVVAGTVGARVVGTFEAGTGAKVGFGLGAGSGEGAGLCTGREVVVIGIVFDWATVNEIVLMLPSKLPPAFIKLCTDTVRVCFPSVISGQEKASDPEFAHIKYGPAFSIL
jgi:hypothetical protein